MFNLLNKNTVTSITTQSGASFGRVTTAAGNTTTLPFLPGRDVHSRSITPSNGHRSAAGFGPFLDHRQSRDLTHPVKSRVIKRSGRTGRSVSVRTHSASKPPSGRALPVGAGV